MADRQRRRLAVLACHLEPEFAGALTSSTCAAVSDPLMFSSMSATTLNTVNATLASVESLPLNSLSAETLNSVNPPATTSLSSLPLNSLSAETLNTWSCRFIPVVNRCEGPVPRFDKFLKASQMCVQEVDKTRWGNKVNPGNETKEGQEEHEAYLDDQPPNFYIQHVL